jgi:hypothetical protein
MINPVYVLDTCAVVWFAKGQESRLGKNALLAMLNPRARVIIPSYVLEEIQRGFGPSMKLGKHPAIPPTAILRLVGKCSNVKVLDRGSAVLAQEFQLETNERQNRIDHQDIPIAAAVLVVREYYKGPVMLVTYDPRLKAWAAGVGITVLWNQRPVEWLPG